MIELRKGGSAMFSNPPSRHRQGAQADGEQRGRPGPGEQAERALSRRQTGKRQEYSAVRQQIPNY
jgi:hypothetical protein